MPTEGERIGPYELLRKLGGGAFGEVWLVRHAELDVERAMKIPTDPDYVKQLRHEGKIQFSLKHPSIVETVDLNTTGDPPYFVMEYVEGEDLRKRLEREGKLPPAKATAILQQILDALATAHGQGVLHRDLKPENILVTPDGTPKIADFGLGRVQADVAQSLLLSGSIVSSDGQSVSGTYAYMSPEQQLGKESDARDDVYAIGVMGCELLTGSRPSGVGVAKLFERAGLSSSLCGVFEKALDDAEHRYANAGDMLAALGRSAGAPVAAAVPLPPPVALSPAAVAVPAAAVPAWKDWVRSTEGRGVKWWGIVAAIVTIAVIGAYEGMADQSDEEEIEAALAFVVCAGWAWVGFGVAWQRTRNRYRLHCAQTHLGQGNFPSGYEAARKLGKLGVDGPHARGVVDGLAALGERLGDPARAQELRSLAASRWPTAPPAG